MSSATPDPAAEHNPYEPPITPPADEPRHDPERHDPYGALRVASYRRFLGVVVLASAGARMQEVAVGWELYDRTRDPLVLGLVGLVMVIPVLALAIPAGTAADRYSKKRLILAAQGLMAVSSLGLFFLSTFRGPIALVYLALFAAGVANAVSMPARWSILRQVVPDHLLGQAITWNSSGWQVAAVVGPALGGALIALTGGAAVAYAVDFAFSLAVLALLAGIQPTSVPVLAGRVSVESLMAGFRFVGSTRLILATITLDLFAVFLGGAVALLPLFARDILQTGPFGLGWLNAAQSIGATVMALTLAHRPPLRRAGPALLGAVTGFGLATVAFGLSRSVALSFGLLVLMGALDNISVVVRSSLIQFLTPEAMRGRVAAVNSIFIGSSNELGGFESGVTARLFGPVPAVILGGVGTVLSVALVAWRWPEVARLGRLDETDNAPSKPKATPGELDPEPAIPEHSLTAADLL